jgi:TonB family protein
MIRGTVPLLLVALLSGRAAAAQAPTGKIIIYREYRLSANTYIPPVFCDGIQVGRFASGAYLEIMASSGNHRCAAGSASSPATMAQVSPEEAVYLRVNVAGGFISHASLTVASSASFKSAPNLTPLSDPIALGRFLESRPGHAPKTGFDHSRRFGDLTVTPFGLATSEQGSGVELLLSVENRGARPACTLLAVRLSTTDGRGYDGVPESNNHPSEELSPGEGITERFEFQTSSEEVPFLLVLKRRPRECRSANPGSGQDDQNPFLITMGLSDVAGSRPRGPIPASAHSDESQGYTSPSCLYCPDPSYSESARKAKFQGTVETQVLVKVDGTIGDVQLLQSSGFADLDEKSLDLIRTWKFKPARLLDGQPVSVSVPVETTFRLL